MKVIADPRLQPETNPIPYGRRLMDGGFQAVVGA